MKKEVKIGLIGVLALLILYYGINYLKGINLFQSSNFYYVEYSNINGLAGSSPVYANGYKIGTVRQIEYNYQKPGNVTVMVEVEKEMRVPKGSYGELVSEMLGTVKMNLILEKGNSYYNPGDTLKGVVDNGLVGIAQDELLPQVEKLLPKMDSILTSLNKLMADPALAKTLNNAEAISANLKSTTASLNHFMNNDLQKIGYNLNVITTNFADISGELKSINYKETFTKIDSTLYNVQMLTSKLNRKDNSLGLLFNDATLYNNLSSTTANASLLLEDLKSNPKRYVHFSLFGKKNK
ncbi:MlaD family protein [Phocaeicola paurosaccharolyticus]|jgi:phospholipid/cholesterol/gamma-HCH transport system substrate-binding protein|uniref:MlaD family protein n=1 Tax=Phocaeicola paurosaccharolyticus TaxID=732242 RepID=UPI002FDF9D6D